MRIGIAGCGLIGTKRALAAKGHTIAMVCDPDAARAQALANATGAAIAADYRAMAAAGLDMVVVATTHDMLAPVALSALEAGSHVLIEKPAARTAQEFAPVLTAAEARGLLVKVGFNHRFHPALQKAHEIVQSGRFGDVLFVRGVYGHGGRVGYEREWRCDKALSGGGELIDQGSHLIDLSRWFLGDLSLDYADTPTLFWPMAVEDNCFLALRSQNGARAWLHAGWSEWKNMFRFEVMCRTGKLLVEGLGKSYGTETLTIYAMKPEMGPPEVEQQRFDGDDASWQLEFDEFARAIAEKRQPLGNMYDAMANLQLIEKAYS